MSVPASTTRGPLELPRLRLADLAARRVAVLGLARSGTALARFLTDQGARVTAYDVRPAGELRSAVADLGGRRVRLMLGPDVDPRAVLAGQDLVCTSPSVSSRYPTTEPRLRAALAELEAAGSTPVVSEVDLFLRLCPALTVGVTGTKGKTTTSSLVAAVLGAGSEQVLLGGNIGTPLVERVPELSERHRVVLELSELQLPTLSRGTQVAVYTHVTSDHLDRHGTLEAYRSVKRRLAELLPPDGMLVVNDEDPVSRTYADATAATLVRYRRSEPPAGGVGVRDGWVVIDAVPVLPALGGGHCTGGPGGRILPLDGIRLPGRHNLSNVCAAIAAGAVMGVAPDAMRAAVEGFEGVEHRLELVAVHAGIRFVNDSQGTQPDAVIAALESFSPPVVLICGGRSKGLPLDELARVAALRVSAAVLMGESGVELGAAFAAAGLAHQERAADMAAAVRTATMACREALAALSHDPERLGTVLLSPAATSFDMFADYAARGRAFRAAVAELVADEQARPEGAPR